MNPTFFCNKKSLQIVSSNIRNDILSLIHKIGSFNLTSKYYTFLNKKNVNNLKENKFLVTLSTFGKKFILFITKYNTKKYCIFINKKNDSMIVTQLKFIDDIFLGTLFDGELVKNENDKWIFLINDIAYCKGVNIITKSFDERQSIIENILKNEYEFKEDNQSLFISKKTYFRYENIKDLIENYMNILNYKCSGLYFKNFNNFSDNYLFIFPECRSDNKILNNTAEELNKNSIANFENDNGIIYSKKSCRDSIEPSHSLIVNIPIFEKDISGSIELISGQLFQESSEDDNILFGNISIINDITDINTNKIILEKETCKFIINTTPMPDIYELYCKNTNNNIEKHSYAGVPDMDVSNFLKKLFKDNYNISNDNINTLLLNNQVIYVECKYHKSFKKWIPFSITNTLDTIQTINKVQIILDSK
jgi:hypothetical protein